MTDVTAETSGTLVVGLGNPILGDDGVGWRVADVVARRLPETAATRLAAVTVAHLALGGLSLMENLIGYRRAIILDALAGTAAPGRVVCLPLEALPETETGHSTAVHDTSLQTAVQLGRRLGAALPEAIWVVGVTIKPEYAFSETLSPAVAGAVGPAAACVLGLLAEREVRHGVA